MQSNDKRLSLIALAIAGAAAASPVSAQSWAMFTSGSGTTTITGTLLGSSVSMSSTYPSGTPTSGATLAQAPGINPPHNTYCIWDSSVPQNSAQLWPASAATPDCAQQVIIGASSSATAANPNRVVIAFGIPMVNPRLMIYSLDNSGIDLSSTRTFDGNPAVLTVTHNNAAIYDAAAQTIGTVGPTAQEGCPNNTPPGRACAYVLFNGIYSQVQVDFHITAGNGDGIGFNIGADAVTPVQLQSFSVD